VLKISTRMKRPMSVEPSSVQAKKQVKVSKATSSTPASTHKVVAPHPTYGSDDDRVVAYSMLKVASVVSSSSSSSSESSTLKLILASPLLIPNLVIASDLPSIPKMPELEATQ
jgi:hypothetical protein